MQKIPEWAYKWEISFNPDLNEQAQEVIFSRKLKKLSHQKSFLIVNQLSVLIGRNI